VLFFWVGGVMIYIVVMFFLNVKLMRFGFDVTTDKEADDEEDLDTLGEIVNIYKAYFLLGWCLVSEAYKFRSLKSDPEQYILRCFLISYLSS
jgi:hypothetical protein